MTPRHRRRASPLLRQLRLWERRARRGNLPADLLVRLWERRITAARLAGAHEASELSERLASILQILLDQRIDSLEKEAQEQDPSDLTGLRADLTSLWADVMVVRELAGSEEALESATNRLVQLQTSIVGASTEVRPVLPARVAQGSFGETAGAATFSAEIIGSRWLGPRRSFASSSDLSRLLEMPLAPFDWFEEDEELITIGEPEPAFDWSVEGELTADEQPRRERLAVRRLRPASTELDRSSEPSGRSPSRRAPNLAMIVRSGIGPRQVELASGDKPRLASNDFPRRLHELTPSRLRVSLSLVSETPALPSASALSPPRDDAWLTSSLRAHLAPYTLSRQSEAESESTTTSWAPASLPLSAFAETAIAAERAAELAESASDRFDSSQGTSAITRYPAELEPASQAKPAGRERASVGERQDQVRRMRGPLGLAIHLPRPSPSRAVRPITQLAVRRSSLLAPPLSELTMARKAMVVHRSATFSHARSKLIPSTPGRFYSSTTDLTLVLPMADWNDVGDPDAPSEPTSAPGTGALRLGHQPSRLTDRPNQSRQGDFSSVARVAGPRELAGADRRRRRDRSPPELEAVILSRHGEKGPPGTRERRPSELTGDSSFPSASLRKTGSSHFANRIQSHGLPESHPALANVAITRSVALARQPWKRPSAIVSAMPIVSHVLRPMKQQGEERSSWPAVLSVKPVASLRDGSAKFNELLLMVIPGAAREESPGMRPGDISDLALDLSTDVWEHETNLSSSTAPPVASESTDADWSTSRRNRSARSSQVVFSAQAGPAARKGSVNTGTPLSRWSAWQAVRSSLPALSLAGFNTPEPAIRDRAWQRQQLAASRDVMPPEQRLVLSSQSLPFAPPLEVAASAALAASRSTRRHRWVEPAATGPSLRRQPVASQVREPSVQAERIASRHGDAPAKLSALLQTVIPSASSLVPIAREREEPPQTQGRDSSLRLGMTSSTDLAEGRQWESAFSSFVLDRYGLIPELEPFPSESSGNFETRGRAPRPIRWWPTSAPRDLPSITGIITKATKIGESARNPEMRAQSSLSFLRLGNIRVPNVGVISGEQQPRLSAAGPADQATSLASKKVTERALYRTRLPISTQVRRAPAIANRADYLLPSRGKWSEQSAEHSGGAVRAVRVSRWSALPYWADDSELSPILPAPAEAILTSSIITQWLASHSDLSRRGLPPVRPSYAVPYHDHGSSATLGGHLLPIIPSVANFVPIREEREFRWPRKGDSSPQLEITRSMVLLDAPLRLPRGRKSRGEKTGGGSTPQWHSPRAIPGIGGSYQYIGEHTLNSLPLVVATELVGERDEPGSTNGAKETPGHGRLGGFAIRPGETPMTLEAWAYPPSPPLTLLSESPVPESSAARTIDMDGHNGRMAVSPRPAASTPASTVVQRQVAAPEVAEKPAVDLDTLARQVYALLKQRLAVERERLGRHSGRRGW